MVQKRTPFIKASLLATCDRCGGLRTEQRPLFTGMYTHCFSCDGPKQTAVPKPVPVNLAGKVETWTNVENLGTTHAGDLLWAEGTLCRNVGDRLVYGCNILHKDEQVCINRTGRGKQGREYCLVRVVTSDKLTQPQKQRDGTVWMAFIVEVVDCKMT